LQSDLNFLRALPCKPLAFAWSVQDLEIAFFSLELMADTEPPWPVGAGAAPCAKQVPAPIARDNLRKPTNRQNTS
jgi:hypothetical protein